MKKIFTKENKATFLNVVANHLHKYRRMMLIFSSLIAVAALFLSIYWEFDENSAGIVIDYVYLASHLFFLAISLGVIALIVLNHYRKISSYFLAVITHIYAFAIVAWSTVLCVFDLQLGLSPFIYIMASTLIAGLFVIEPIFFTATTILSVTSILAYSLYHRYDFFTGPYGAENIANLLFSVVIVVLISIRHYTVTTSEYKAVKKLEELSYQDQLTGLLNERSYLNEIDKINEGIKNKTLTKFAVILMDVNNLKATNDAYGHRYGCHLIVRCGHTLKEIFKSSKLFHVGGDEFIVIVYDEDYDNFEKVMEDFDNRLTYSLIEFEGKELIFSVARGYKKFTNEEKYRDVLQVADNLMYENKKYLKEKYGMKSR